MAQTILEQTTVTAVDSNGMLALVFSESFALTAGETYRIVFDNVDYNCTAAEANFNGTDGVGVGNFAIVGLGENTGEPFLIGIAGDGSGVAGYTTDTTTNTHNIAIYTVEAAKGYDIVLKDRLGVFQAYEGVNKVLLNTADGGTQLFTAGEPVPKTVVLDFSAGDMEVTPEAGTVFSLVNIPKPATLIAGNIAQGVRIAGIDGELAGGDAIAGAIADGSVTSVTIPEGLTIIRNYVFWDCTNLESVVLPSTLTSIGNNAFRATALTSVTIPEGVTSIGAYAFHDCTNLESIVLPSTLTSIGSNCFQGCTNLKNVTINGTGLTSIPGLCFGECSNLTSFVIPSSVTSIGESAFRTTGLTSITIPANVTNMGRYVFRYCDSLATATFEKTSTWKYSSSGTGSWSTISSSSLANTTTAATYLRTTYTTYYWQRT